VLLQLASYLAVATMPVWGSAPDNMAGGNIAGDNIAGECVGCTSAGGGLTGGVAGGVARELTKEGAQLASSSRRDVI
jgi:hypothetical protein